MSEKKKLAIIGIVVVIIIGAMGLVYYDSYKAAEAEMEKFYKAFNSEEQQTILIGRATCYYCQILKPIIDDFDNQFNFGYTYIDTDKLWGSNLTEILTVLDIDTETFGTPHTAIVKNKEKLAELGGAESEKNYFNFLKENNVIAQEENTVINYIDYEQYTKLLEDKKTGTIIVIGDSSDENYQTMMTNLRKLNKEQNVTINYFSMLEITQEISSEFSNVVLPTMIVINDKQEKVDSIGNKTYDEYLTFLQNNGIIK